MKRTFLMTGLAVLTLAFFMTGCNSMKKLQKEVIETAVVGYVNPEQLEFATDVFTGRKCEKRQLSGGEL